MIRIIFIDIDGTLFDSYGKLSFNNKHACIKVQKAGIPVVINTGRYGSNAIKVAKMINVDHYNGYVIGNDGAEIWSFSEQKWIFLSQIKSETILQLTNWLTSYHQDFIINFNCINSLYINRLYDKWAEWLKDLQIQIIEFHQVSDIKEPVSKVIVILEHYWNSEKITKFIKQFEIQFPDLTIVQYHTNVFAIGNKNNSKGSAVSWLCQKLKISEHDAMAIGDNFNDLPMFEIVGYPVVMDNAHEAVKTYAKWIAPNNDNSGVSQAIDHYLWNKKEH